jgi:hypothetical protein
MQRHICNIMGQRNRLGNSMTYIVDQKLVADTELTDTTKGQVIMGVRGEHTYTPAHLKLARIIGPDDIGHSLQVDSQEITHWLREVVSLLKVANIYLSNGADMQVDPNDVEDL